ncbi:hypothetical protein V6N13_084996 [Hibiscus sabdariffa]
MDNHGVSSSPCFFAVELEVPVWFPEFPHVTYVESFDPVSNRTLNLSSLGQHREIASKEVSVKSAEFLVDQECVSADSMELSQL